MVFALRHPVMAGMLVLLGLVVPQVSAVGDTIEAPGLPVGSYATLPALGFNQAILHGYALGSLWQNLSCSSTRPVRRGSAWTLAGRL